MRQKFLLLILIAAALSAVLSACSAAAPEPTATPVPPTATPAPERVEVALNDFTVEASQTEFQAGKTYEFVITNNGVLPHEFRIIPPADEHGMDSMDTHSDEMHNEALFVVAEEELQPGASQTVEFTFPADSAHTELEFACHIAGHYEAGMVEEISVAD